MKNTWYTRFINLFWEEPPTITLKDIAKEANVSLMTVSNVVNGNLHKVSKEKAEEIKHILETRHYVQNATARSLAKAHSNIVAIMLRNVRGENSMSSPHNAALLGEIIQRLQFYGYYAMINLVETREDIARNLKSWNARGAIFLGMLDNEIEQIYSLSSIPMVFIDSYSNVRQLSSVGIDDYKGGALAAEYFWEKGHRSIAFVSPPDYENSVIQHRLRGFLDTLERHQITLTADHRLVLESDVEPSVVERAVQKLASMRGRVTAAFVTSDQMAASFVGGLYATGIRVPEDISIIGFDNMPISRQTTPQLTTIEQNLSQKASFAVDILERRLKTPSAPAESRILDVRLVERASVIRIGSNGKDK
ncbi:MAG: LacI family DNA-binding transcriptional regulator [Eubacteriales bacterium]|nr:LacI family DNA-binding transcriptional regulator [Eubacteriales bacterium]